MEQIVKFKTDKGAMDFDLFKIIGDKDIYAPDKNKPNFKVITYDGCKKLADYRGVVLKETPQFLVQPNSDNMQQHVWGMWLGFKGTNDRDERQFCEWEASQLNTGQIVKTKDGSAKHDQWTKIDAQFKSAMAYKRAYCRGVLRILGLLGMYSAVESPSFETNGEAVDYANL